MNEHAQVEVILATYNGEKYLPELLESLLTQSFTNFRILVRDDGSTDQTMDILTDYQITYSDKITILEDEYDRHGLLENFSVLLEESTSPYVMLCDQDDVWLPDKITHSIAAIKELEEAHPPKTPALIHTDLTIVDQNLQLINPSFFSYSGLDSSRNRFNQLLVQNNVTGCATIMNRDLVNKVVPIPSDARMHDWWIALVASAMGKIGFIPKATILYRQHSANMLGAKGYTFQYIVQTAREILRVQKESILKDNFIQAERFREKYAKQLSQEDLEILDQFIGIQQKGYIGKRYTLFKYGFLKEKFAQNIGLFIKI